MTIKFVDHSFVPNLKDGLNMKTKAAKLFTFFQAEIVSTQTAVHAVHCLINLVEMGKFIFRQHNEGQPFCISIGHILLSFIVTSLQFPS